MPTQNMTATLTTAAGNERTVTLKAGGLAGTERTVTGFINSIVVPEVDLFQEWKGWEDRFTGPPDPEERMRHAKHFENGELKPFKESGF